MNKYDPNIHHRKSIRLKGYDYSQEGLYFITICCQDRAHIFGKILNGEMKLNIFGEIAYQEWMTTEKIRDNTALHEFIVMPNHIHGIIEILFKKGNSENKIEEIGKFKSPSQSIGSIIRGYKIATIKKIKDKILKEGNRKDKDKKKNNSTGELPFAPTPFAPTPFASTPFAPTPFASIPFVSTPTPFVPPEKIIQLDFKIWQRNYYEHIIRNKQEYQRISDYITNNPKKWDEDKFYKK